MPGQHDPPRTHDALINRLSGRADEHDGVRESYGGSRPNSEDDLMLDVRLSDGARNALAYGTLLKVAFSPADRVTLVFAAETVVIEGKRLLPLYELLRRHRAKFVQEGTTAEEGLKPDEAAHIDQIRFEKPKEEL